ncbi:hypothetical protein CFC21_106156 [Triticum aestivum]|uniref:DUF3615 domain-containing protein n=2 Tax=Triticum aestivum TaxID=4565 RepID=A0A3B6SUI3_WHEAT|nr:uncharacterized protein LOC123160718 [Triticum aestivum]KAF7105334.1 hypothetical protein CFC21_106156 [Triticum aestivum]
MSDTGGGGGGGVLYKRIPPPEPEPQHEEGPRFPTSPSYECYPEYGSMADYIPARTGHRGLSDDYHDYWARNPDNSKMIPPPPEPQDEEGPRLPTSPSYECYPQYGSMADYIPAGLSDDYHDYWARNPSNVPTYNIGGDSSAFDAMYEDDDCGLTAADLERQTNEYITAALDHYNSQDQNQVKYELVRAIYTSTAIMDERGFYGHVNFTAKSSLENSKEELLFAEVYYERGSDTCIPTSIVSLEGQNGVGGVRGKDICGPYRGMEIRVDTQHCYACLEAVKHPEDGTLYETGHHVDGCYGYLL